MIITDHTTKERAIRNVQNREMLGLNTQIYIRKSFDNALTSLEAESWITIAKEQGLNELASEMKRDLQFELLIA